MSLSYITDRVEYDTAGGCWLWPAATSSNGYGAAYDPYTSRQVSAHRLSWKLAHGSYPQKGMFVCHKCDVKACCNPAHLFVGTPRQNTADMMAKGRRVAPVVINRPRGDNHPSRMRPECLVRGGSHHQAKLTESDVVAIRSSSDKGVDLSRRYGVSSAIISAVRLRRIWKHVP